VCRYIKARGLDDSAAAASVVLCALKLMVMAIEETSMDMDPAYWKQVWAYTRPLLSSTSAVLVSEPSCVQHVTSYNPSICCRYPTCLLEECLR